MLRRFFCRCKRLLPMAKLAAIAAMASVRFIAIVAKLVFGFRENWQGANVAVVAVATSLYLSHLQRLVNVNLRRI